MVPIEIVVEIAGDQGKIIFSLFSLELILSDRLNPSFVLFLFQFLLLLVASYVFEWSLMNWGVIF